MSVQKINVLAAPLGSASPGASWSGDLAAWLFGADDAAGSRLVARIESIRARLAAGRRARQEANGRARVLALARRYEATQPEFAKDLYAAVASDRQPLGIGFHR
ncbi:MAG: hypothetical protein ACXWCO_12595 [Caldimonas sp.]